MSTRGLLVRVLPMLLVGLLLTGCTLRSTSQDGGHDSREQLSWPLASAQVQDLSRAKIGAPNAELSLELAVTAEERQQGLSGRDELVTDGMLFVIDPARQTDIWMRGMRFDLDIVWVRNGLIVHQEYAVPAADPNDSSPPTYGPEVPVDAVIEVGSGMAEEWGLAEGEPLELLGLE